MNHRDYTIKSDEGSALALVLFFIIVISLWLGSVALLTQSTSTAIKTNISESKLRSDYVNLGIRAALIALTKDPICPLGNIDDATYLSSCRSGTQILPCSSLDVDDAINDQLKLLAAKQPEIKLNGKNEPDIVVHCGNSDQSGFEDPGSLLLLGDGTSCGGSGCTVGQDYGLSIAASSAKDFTTPSCSKSAGTITSAVSNGSSVTYFVNSDTPNFVPGDKTTITGVISSSNPKGKDELGFNVFDAQITASTTTSFTVSKSLSKTEVYLSGGEATRSSSRYLISGGVVNLSGKWNGVDCTDFEITKSSSSTNPEIIQPDSSKNSNFCPANLFPCISLKEWGGKASGTGKVINLTQSKLNSINSFVNKIADNIDSFPGNRAKVNPPDASCDKNSLGSGSKKYIRISPGYISNDAPEFTDDLTLSRLNDLTKSCGDGSSAPAIIFQPGVYGFVGSPSSGSTTDNTWSINFTGSVPGSVFAGLPNWEQDGSNFNAPCGSNPEREGVRFLFKYYSYIELKRGQFIACASSKTNPLGSDYEPVVTQPIFSAPSYASYSNSTKVKFYWGSSNGNSGSSGAFYTSARGNNSGDNCVSADVCANFVGSIFAPDSWLNIELNGKTISTFKKGMFVKGLTISQTDSGPPTKWVASSGVLTTGDRQVQLNFFRRSSMQYLGSVQLKISDSGGYKLASSYIRKAWRVGW